MALNVEVHAKKTFVAVVYKKIKRLAIEIEKRPFLFLCVQINLYGEVVIVVMAELTY